MGKFFIYGLCFLVFSWGCDSAGKPETEHAHEHIHGEFDHDHEDHDHKHDDHDHGDEIGFTAEQAKAFGLKTIAVTPGIFSQVIKVSGQILSAPGDEVTVAATHDGVVSSYRTAVSEGQAVKSGEPLLAISADRLVDGNPVARVKAAFIVAEKEFQRAKLLIEDKLISQKEYNGIELAYENARIAYEASADRQTEKGTNIVSPIGGYIKTRLVGEGEHVTAGQPLFTLTKNKRLWLQADVSERYYSQLKEIHSANFKTPYDDALHRLSDLNGRLVSFGKSTGNNAFYIPVNFEFDNVGEVVTGSYVEVFLLGKPREHTIAVPLSSLTEAQGLYFVYLRVHENAYKRQEVKTGVSDGERIEIVSGLNAGDVVVCEGAYHMKQASASASIPHGHEH